MYMSCDGHGLGVVWHVGIVRGSRILFLLIQQVLPLLYVRYCPYCMLGIVPIVCHVLPLL